MYIFVCSPGRSGTKYLSEIFKNNTNLNAYHGGEIELREVIDKGYYKTNNKKYVLHRLNMIKNINKNKKGFVETSQIFIHYLANGIIDNKLMRPLYVINLIRNPMEVAVSYENRKSYPSDNKNLWRLPLNHSNRLLKVDDNKKFTIFQENLIDLIDTQMKFEKYKNSFDKYYELKFEDLNNKEKIKEVMHYFGVKYFNNKNILQKNENKIKTIITEKHINEKNSLIEYLKTLDNYPENIINNYI